MSDQTDKQTFESMAKDLGFPRSGGFLQLVAMRAKTLKEHHPDRADDAILEEAMRQTIERERYLMNSDNEDAKIFRRVLCASVYGQARAKGYIDTTLDRIEEERAADALRDAYKNLHL